ncbi:MAG: zinc ABC transporter substrate-binding protein [Clostridiales bacterium]|nr:MAG: zinc ABC transporter substrate-binding protein [Clostridiales bacterium]
MKKTISVLLTVIFFVGFLSACVKDKEIIAKKGLSIISTIFPGYDFASHIVGDKVFVKMLLTPGAESHSFEPTAQDIISIQNCDLFIYVGGENDTWVDSILSSFDKPVKTLKMIDCVTAVEEEIKEGMETEQHSHETNKDPEYDEHVWTSPQNAIKITQKIADTLSEISPSNSEKFKQNTVSYITELSNLDNSFKDFFASIKNKTLIFADRFPMQYFTDAYGLDYYAAFPGCAGETEPSAATVAYLINKIQSEKIKAVYYIELSNHKVADGIAEDTGVQARQINTCHNVTKEQFAEGATYVSLMEENLRTFKETMN